MVEPERTPVLTLDELLGLSDDGTGRGPDAGVERVEEDPEDVLRQLFGGGVPAEGRRVLKARIRATSACDAGRHPRIALRGGRGSRDRALCRRRCSRLRPVRRVRSAGGGADGSLVGHAEGSRASRSRACRAVRPSQRFGRRAVRRRPGRGWGTCPGRAAARARAVRQPRLPSAEAPSCRPRRFPSRPRRRSPRRRSCDPSRLHKPSRSRQLRRSPSLRPRRRPLPGCRPGILRSRESPSCGRRPKGRPRSPSLRRSGKPRRRPVPRRTADPRTPRRAARPSMHKKLRASPGRRLASRCGMCPPCGPNSIGRWRASACRRASSALLCSLSRQAAPSGRRGLRSLLAQSPTSPFPLRKGSPPHPSRLNLRPPRRCSDPPRAAPSR